MSRLIIITLFFSFTTTLFSQAGDHKAYIRDYREIAIEEMDGSGIPASIKMAQGILESGAGASTLSRKANNHFGIKCGGSWNGATYYHEDDDYDKKGNLIKSCFRKYGSADESYRAHTVFLQSNQRYAFLFSYDKTDYKNWARGLKKAGYATNPKYPNLLIDLIERYELHKLDKMTSEILVFEDDKEEKPITKPPAKPSTKPGTSRPSSRKESVNNQVKMIIAKNGDTHAKLASTYNIGLSRLLKYNDLSRSTALQDGDFVYTQPKRKKYRNSKSTHRVKAGENMYAISQKYGIRLECLYKRNRMNLGTQPAVGERLSIKKKAKTAPKTARPGSTKPPVISKPPPAKPPITSKPPTTMKKYVVKKGDTLWGIANKHGMSVDELKTLNKLTSNVISVGQELKVK